jgi:hypothetical protein
MGPEHVWVVPVGLWAIVLVGTSTWIFVRKKMGCYRPTLREGWEASQQGLWCQGPTQRIEDADGYYLRGRRLCVTYIIYQQKTGGELVEQIGFITPAKRALSVMEYHNGRLALFNGYREQDTTANTDNWHACFFLKAIRQAVSEYQQSIFAPQLA